MDTKTGIHISNIPEEYCQLALAEVASLQYNKFDDYLLTYAKMSRRWWYIPR